VISKIDLLDEFWWMLVKRGQMVELHLCDVRPSGQPHLLGGFIQKPSILCAATKTGHNIIHGSIDMLRPSKNFHLMHTMQATKVKQGRRLNVWDLHVLCM
jgi:hypothetical protein